MSHLCFLQVELVSYLGEFREIIVYLNFLQASSIGREAFIERNCISFRVLSPRPFFFSMEHEYGVKDIPSNLRLREEFSSQPAPQNWQNEEDCALQAQQEIQDRAEP